MNYDAVITNARIASMTKSGQPYGELEASTLAIKDGCIAALLSADSDITATRMFDAKGKWLLPGLIDCHSHIVYGGDRAHEFALRLQGVSYKTIAEQGGGIMRTVTDTRVASTESLLASAKKRALRLCEEGVTTLEIKSGYGLDEDTELRMLKVAKSLAKELPLTVSTTYLGAHAIPPEYKGRADDYITFVCEHMIPKVAAENLADAVDVFCESIGFTTAQTERVFQAAQQQGLSIKAHVEQLSDQKGAALAARYHALSVDHIEYLAPQDIPTLTESGSVAVLLPGAFYYLNETRKPPIQVLREHNVPMAVATDFNPGSSPVASLLTALNMACVLFGLTPEEALQGATINAAHALGLSDRGQIAVGQRADLTLWEVNTPAELVYSINGIRPSNIWVGGKHV
ncbi:imidazolonepropionase [Alteromonas flava]|uniref:imidazolonepropionase n=1 Tax=Alteromonas flava TaxID=2048003 RepID=UPI000C289BCD|nr:imidazolonepropionase [Alteromonas flava]